MSGFAVLTTCMVSGIFSPVVSGRKVASSAASRAVAPNTAMGSLSSVAARSAMNGAMTGLTRAQTEQLPTPALRTTVGSSSAEYSQIRVNDPAAPKRPGITSLFQVAIL